MLNRPDDLEEGPAATEIADVFSRTSKILARRFDERLGEHGSSLPRSRVLVEVARRGPVRVTDVAHAVGIAQGTASTLIEALVRDGLVTRTVDVTDRRATNIVTTPGGARQADDWLRAYDAVAAELFSPLPRARWGDLMDILAVLGDED